MVPALQRVQDAVKSSGLTAVVGFHSLEQALDTSKSSPLKPKSRWVPTIGDESYRLRASIPDHSRRFSVALDAAQPSPHATYIATYIETADWAISSVSPELFFQVENGSAEMRPMKGTIGRGQTPEHELAESKLKTAVLSRRTPTFELLETIR